MNPEVTFDELTRFTEDDARAYLEAIRWPDGPFCPKCGSCDSYALTAKLASKRPVRKGVHKCKDCRKQFTVTVGTVFEGSHIPIRSWLLAIYLMCSSKKGMSAHQLHRTLGINYRSAWFLAQRIRYAFAENPYTVEKLNGTVEVDETYVGGKPRHKGPQNRRGRGTHKAPVIALVERDGKVRTRTLSRVTSQNVKSHIREHVDAGSVIMTDELSVYEGLHLEYKEHYVIKHKEAYVRGIVHTNTVEGFFSLLKRGLMGTFHQVSKKYLPLYLKEFDFRYNHRALPDSQRTAAALQGIEGKRMMLRDRAV